MEVPPVPLSRRSVELHLERTNTEHYDRVKDGWIDSIPASPYPQLPPLKPVVTAIVTRHDSPTEFSQRSNSPPEKTPVARTRKSSISSTSTLFERSNSMPISIIVTTPDDEVVTDGPGFRRIDSTTSLPPLNSQIVPDRSRLMPPIDPQLDMRRLRKAREFEEIKTFLIGFINTKGAKLPGNLRVRIMSIYGITEGNLDPKAVEKFGSSDCADLDESLVLNLGLQGGTPSNRDHMKILELAFQSVLPSAAPMAAGDIMALRRRSMMAGARNSRVASSSASLYSVDETSSVSQNMSLTVNNKSKQLMDDIIKKRSAAQNANKPVEDSFKKTPGRPQSLFGRRTSVPRSTVQKAESLYAPESVSPASQARSRRGSVTSLVSLPSSVGQQKQRPQSLYRYKTDPAPAFNYKPSIPKAPLPAFNNTTLRSRQSIGEFKPVISITPYKPAVSSRLTTSPISAYRPESNPRPNIKDSSSHVPSFRASPTLTAAMANRKPAVYVPLTKVSKQEKPVTSPVVHVTKAAEVSPKPQPRAETPVQNIIVPPPKSPKRQTPASSIRSFKIEQPAPLPVPEIKTEQLPAPSRNTSLRRTTRTIEAAKEELRSLQPSSPSPLHEPQQTPKSLPQPQISRPVIPQPIKTSPPLESDPIIHAPTPISPAHRLTHKGLTRSELSEIEKPFTLLQSQPYHTHPAPQHLPRRRRSSSTTYTTPASPLFSSPNDSELSSNGYESDSSGIMFPVHPSFAPLGRENCGASRAVEDRRVQIAMEKMEKERARLNQGAGRKSHKLKKEKKDEKPASLFGSFKKSLFGKS